MPSPPDQATAPDAAGKQPRAPIQYADVAKSYNTVRAFSHALLATLSFVEWVQATPHAGYIGLMGLAGSLHALYERSARRSALAPLLVDASIIGLISIFHGHAASLQGAGFVYVISAALLLLPPQRAGFIIVYAATWAVPLLVMDGVRSTEDAIFIDLGAVVATTAIVSQLLVATGRALFAAEARHREALDAERRALELKDEFVSMVSHELRTPLTSIGGFADTLRESWASLPPDEVDEFLVIMRGEANHLSNLVEDILVIPRLEAGRLRLEPETIGLRTEAFEAARLVFAGTTREIQVDVPADIFVTADPNRLRQILRNLLENARKYGGDQVLIAGERSGDSYMVVIADNGTGIPPEDRERIFEHFEQAVKGDARSEGVGLGLPIARKLARAMGGDLWFEPRFPTGAQFFFTLKLATDAPGGVTLQATSDTVTPIRKTG